ncbi:hypothetical protein DdX_07369 [Ditylenchus destructor]|uniref:Uncharacterized protein n=1 Tax=Ditylenchus destructor TaxID=166010 RepID=A0AAD4N694_9BILA|nr:hypothetical protein DdX_07369 [Ditylenchus destructor]
MSSFRISTSKFLKPEKCIHFLIIEKLQKLAIKYTLEKKPRIQTASSRTVQLSYVVNVTSWKVIFDDAPPEKRQKFQLADESVLGFLENYDDRTLIEILKGISQSYGMIIVGTSEEIKQQLQQISASIDKHVKNSRTALTDEQLEFVIQFYIDEEKEENPGEQIDESAIRQREIEKEEERKKFLEKNPRGELYTKDLYD